MDFNVIRPKPPQRKPDPPPPPPPPVEQPPPPPPEQYGVAAPPYGPFTPYMDELQRMERLKSVEYSNSRCWKMNFDEYPNQQQFGSSEYHHYPIVRSRGAHNYNHGHHPPPHDHLHGPGPRLGLPPVDQHYGPPTGFGPPPPDHHYGPPPNLQYGHPAAPPHHGGLFSDENPNGCMIM